MLAKMDIRTRPKNRQELFEWCKSYFGFHFARRAVVEGHSAPLDVLAELVFEEVLDMVILASRTGGKTLLVAVANVVDALFRPGCEIASLGAILYQAEKGYRYLVDMFGHDLLREDVIATLMKETKLKNGSLIQILTGTMAGVNAPHPHKARADEVELIDWTIVQQFFSMARSEKGITGQNVMSSTRKGLFGSMQKLIDKMQYDPGFPFKLRTWGVLDAMEPCSGASCFKCKDVIRGDDQRSWFDVCQKRLMDADGFYTIGDAQRKFLTLDPDVWDAEWECKKPSSRGLVYPIMNEERYAGFEFDPMKEFWCGCDDGFSDPFCFLAVQSDPSNNVYILDELYGSGIEHSTWMDRIEEMLASYGQDPKRVVIHIDVRAAALRAEMKKRGWNVRSRSYLVNDTVGHVRKWFTGRKHPKLYVNGPKCPNCRREFELYRYKKIGDSPLGEDDHAPDALRYGICGRFPVRQTSSGFDQLPISGGDKRKSSQDSDTKRDMYGLDKFKITDDRIDYPIV